jgi:hypothetical protein
LRKQDVRVVSLATTDLKSFVSARIAALDGVQVVLACGPRIDISLLRARAAENRVFVIAGLEKIETVVAPDGIVSSLNSTGEIALAIHEADVKQFTPTTDLWAQRRTNCYKFPLPQVTAKPQPTLV